MAPKGESQKLLDTFLLTIEFGYEDFFGLNRI
jgi:hypothetical protein